MQLVLLVATLACAQESKKYIKLRDDYRYKEVEVLKGDGTTEHGLFKDTNERNRFIKVQFVSKDGKKISYFPNYILAYSFDDEVFYSNGNSFLRWVLVGEHYSIFEKKWTNYRSISTANGGTMSYHAGSGTSYYIKKENNDIPIWKQEYKKIEKKKFKENFIEYFKGCPLIIKHIESGKITYDNYHRLFEYSNKFCTKSD